MALPSGRRRLSAGRFGRARAVSGRTGEEAPGGYLDPRSALFQSIFIPFRSLSLLTVGHRNR